MPQACRFLVVAVTIDNELINASRDVVNKIASICNL